MRAQRKASIRELAAAAYELDVGVIQGHLHRSAEGGRWMVGTRVLDEWLAEYDGQDVVMIAASLDDERPVRSKVCRTCGTEYVGMECPRCREARIRLRGR